MTIIKRFKQILVNIEGFVEDTTDTIFESVKLTAIASVVLAIVSTIEIFGSSKNSLTGLPLGTIRNLFGMHLAPVAVFFGVIIGSVVLLLVGSLVLHFFAYIFGARNGFSHTVPAMVVFLVPNLLFGWIPLVNIWTSIYTFLIIVYVLAKKQNLSMAKATTVIAAPIIIITLVVALSGSSGGGGMIQTLVPIPGI